MIRFLLLGRAYEGGAYRDFAAVCIELDDVVIARAPAQVAFQPVPDLLFRRICVVLQQVDRAHDHAGRAEPALQAVLFAKCGLHGMQRVAVGQALDSRDLRALGLYCEQGAALDRAAIHVNDAGAALAGVTAHVRAGQTEVVAERKSTSRVRGSTSPPASVPLTENETFIVVPTLRPKALHSRELC